MSLSLVHSQSHLSQPLVHFFLAWLWVRQSGSRWWFGDVVLGEWLIEWVEIVEQWRSAWFMGFDWVVEIRRSAWFMGFDWVVEIRRVVTGLIWIRIGWFRLVWWWCGDGVVVMWWLMTVESWRWGLPGWWRGGFTSMVLGLLSWVWVWVCHRGLLPLFVCVCVCVCVVDYGLLVVVVSGVCSAAVVGSWWWWFR